jgi:hypothetical protein
MAFVRSARQDLSRFSLTPIMKAAWGGFMTPGSGRLGLPTLVFVVIVPLGAGVAPWLWPLRITDASIPPLLTTLGLLTSSLLAAFVLMVNTRLKVSESNDQRHRAKLARLLSRTGAACLYSSVLSVVMLLVIISASVWAGAFPSRADHAWLPATSALFAIGLHLVAVLVTVVRRIFGVYYSLFRGDFVIAGVEDDRAA